MGMKPVRMSLAIVLLLASIGIIGLSGCNGDSTTTTTGTTPPPTTTGPPMTTTGFTAQLYLDNCAVCHGADREGGLGPPITPTLIGEFNTDLELFYRIQDHYPARVLGESFQRELAAYLWQETH